MMELYKRYRPTTFNQVLGQEPAIRTLIDFGKRKAMPHTLLFSGPSGVGKTTLARIVQQKMGCSKNDFYEMNTADFRGVDMVREIRSRMMLAPLGGKCRIWLLDEVHQLTGIAQDAFLKILEDTPSHIYFMLATTDPEKLKETIRTRCTEFKLQLLGPKVMETLIGRVLEGEGVKLGEEVMEKIVNNSDGSPRKALVLLDQVIGLGDEEKQLEVIESSDVKSKAIEIARLLINPKTRWSEMAKVLREVKDDPEQLRWMVLGYCNSILLKGGKMADRAFQIVEVFGENFYNTKRTGLTAACYELIVGV